MENLHLFCPVKNTIERETFRWPAIGYVGLPELWLHNSTRHGTTCCHYLHGRVKDILFTYLFWAPCEVFTWLFFNIGKTRNSTGKRITSTRSQHIEPQCPMSRSSASIFPPTPNNHRINIIIYPFAQKSCQNHTTQPPFWTYLSQAGTTRPEPP